MSNLKRPRHPIPGYIKRALEEGAWMEAYRRRPAYQRNDYLSWIERAKRPQTKEKKLHQSLRSLSWAVCI